MRIDTIHYERMGNYNNDYYEWGISKVSRLITHGEKLFKEHGFKFIANKAKEDAKNGAWDSVARAYVDYQAATGSVEFSKLIKRKS